MELARDIQKVFYNEQTTNEQSYRETNTPTSKLTNGSTVLRNLPTLTTNDGIKGADATALLPGYQFVWTVSHPQHCHMFHQLLAGSAPWYFGHIYLPTNNQNKDDDENSNTIDDIQSYNDIQQQLKSDGSTLYGTLLRVTDRIFQDDDGHIVLAVQAIEKFRVHNLASLPGTSLRTDVQISPDRELIQSFFDKALLSSASYLSDISGDGSSSQVLSSPSAINGAARAAAVADSNRMRKFEYHPIFLEKKPTVQSRLQSNPNDSNAKKMIKDAIKKKEEKESSGAEYVSVVQLANFCAFEFASLSKSDTVTSQALKTYWEHMAKEHSSQGMNTDEEDMFSDDTTSSSSTSFFLPELATTSQPPASADEIEMKEMQLWVSLDDMIRLLSMAASSTVPLPSQLLGLLPKRNDWPKYFQLEEYANRFKGNTIGTAFQSPFVRVDQITCSNSSLSYSPLRRAQRLSYAIWLLLDGLSMTGAEPAPPPRHLLLEMDMAQRLDAARATLEGINTILKQMLPEKKDDDEKK